MFYASRVDQLSCTLEFFSKWGSPSPCIEEMHTACFYFIYSTKTGQRPYNDHTSQSHQKKVSKHHQTSTGERTKKNIPASANADQALPGRALRQQHGRKGKEGGWRRRTRVSSRSPHGGDARGVVIPCTLELRLTKVQLLGWILMKNIFDRNKRRIIQLIISCAPN
jgi:hypothetical protein